MGRAEIFGRESELEQIAKFLGDVGPAALQIEGVAGIGKTTLWKWAVETAPERGYRVLIARASKSETKLPFAALGDLLDPVADEVLADLPPPQRVALEAALLRADALGSGPDQRAVSVASLEVLRAIAETTPLILAIDDVQWLDSPSARVLGFAIRRLREERIGIVAALRVGEPGGDLLNLKTLPGDQVRLMVVEALSLGAIWHLIHERLGAALPRPVVQRVHQMADGNPFFCLEIARELMRRGVPRPGDAMPVPDDLHDLLKIRLEVLPQTSRRVLLAAAAAARATEPLVAAASGVGARTPAALAKAERAGVVAREDDQIRFTHPLLASSVYGAASARERRSVHRRLAEHVDDPQEQALHLALGTTSSDADVASALDAAARLARGRGAPDSAAELSELARRLTPENDGDALRRRTVTAAEHHLDAGDDARAKALLDEAIRTEGPGRDRARLCYRLAAVSWMDMPKVQELCEEALRTAGHDRDLVAAVHDHLAWVDIYRGDLLGASEHARWSTKWVQLIQDPAIRADVLSTLGMVEFLRGRSPETFNIEAEALQDSAATPGSGLQATIYTAVRTCHGLQQLWAGDLDGARQNLHKELALYEERGRYLFREEILCYLAELECRAGNWDLADRQAQEAYEIGVESGRISAQGHLLFPKALVAAHKGDVDQARSDAEEGLRLCVLNEDLLDASCNRAVLGFIELSLSNPEGAIEHLKPVLEYLQTLGAAEPAIIPCVPDMIEALVSLGELEDAEALLIEHEAKGRSLDRPWALATAARCWSLLAAARGDQPQALYAIEEAMLHHERVLQPFELGRTLLVAGEVHRRARQKRNARLRFEAALDVFVDVGAPLWAHKAKEGLRRTGVRAESPAGLTPTERRVAELVAEGRTNKEVANALFVSLRTVESNLTRIYNKLGVRSRTELTRSLLAKGSSSEKRR